MNILIRKIIATIVIVCSGITLSLAQDVDLFKQMDEQNKADQKEKTDIVTSTFKTTRIVDGQSIENVGAGILDVKILHRFGMLNQGPYNFMGLDQASMRIGVDYGVTKRLMVGIGRSTFQKQFDGFAKYRIFNQTTGKKNFPIAVSYVGTLTFISDTNLIPKSHHFSDRIAYVHQIIIARKFNDFISVQLVPTLVHYNIVDSAKDNNDLFSLGIGSRIRVSKRVNLTGEYFYQFNKLSGNYYNSFSMGVDIETGGHVFQFHVTNSTGMTESTFINQTSGRWGNGDIHFGFNIARVFTVKKPKEIKS